MFASILGMLGVDLVDITCYTFIDGCSAVTKLADLPRAGGHVVLNLVNTVDWRTSDEPIEYLHAFDDVLQFGTIAGIITPAERTALSRAGTATARARAYKRVIDFREAAYRVLRASMEGRSPRSADLRLIGDVVSEAQAARSLTYEHGAFSLALKDRTSDARLPLWRVALQLGELLTSGVVWRIRECGGPGCGWLFLDTTKSHTRRWCTMEGCGNRAKARRFYARRQ